MNKEVCKRAWVTPRLEQIAMLDTTTCVQAGQTVPKNSTGAEAGCGMGLGS